MRVWQAERIASNALQMTTRCVSLFRKVMWVQSSLVPMVPGHEYAEPFPEHPTFSARGGGAALQH